jgi:GGDEF domain-containing protein
MNRRILVFYYIISMLFLLFILLFAAYRLKITIDGNREEAENALESLRISALSIYLAEGDFESEYFRTTMRRKFSDTDRLLLLAIYSKGDGIFYLISEDPSYLSASPGQSNGTPWLGEPDYTIRPVYENRITLPLSPGMGNDLYIDGIFSDLNKEQLYPILREIFYILLVYFLIASVFLLAAATVKSPGQQRVSAGASSGSRVYRSRSAPDSRLPPASPLPEQPARVLAGPDQAAGLFSPATGLGWSQHLSARLTSELERAAGSDQDLSLMLISCRNCGIRDLALSILEAFPLRDLAFEYDAETIAVIIPDKDLDHCLREAKDFQNRYSRAAAPVSVGLSARNGRLVSSSRLLSEAAQALKQAETSEEGQIVAFRADPDKYRASIAARSAGRGR